MKLTLLLLALIAISYGLKLPKYHIRGGRH
jgi:hypothetical protein